MKQTAGINRPIVEMQRRVNGMKRILIFLMILVLSLPAVALGEEYQAVVANPNAADRLNLREKPDTDSKTLGRFYSGTPVTVHSERTVGYQTWARVTVGEMTGYMLSDYLMEVNRNYGAPSLFFTAYPSGGGCALREEPRSNADQVDYLGSGNMVYILGDIGDDWRYVQSERGVYGYVRTNQLINREIKIEEAYLGRMNEEIPVYSDKEMKKQIAVYYPGARCRVSDMNRQKGYARVEISGMAYTAMVPGRVTKGYVSLDDLTVFIQPWQVECGYRDAEVKADFTMTGENTGETVTVKKGTVLTVIGETENEYHVLYRGNQYANADFDFVGRSLLEMLPGRGGDFFSPDALGYAYIEIPLDEENYLMGVETWRAPGEEKGEITYHPLAQVIGRSNGYLQLSQPGLKNFFIEEEKAEIIWRKDLFSDTQTMKTAGEWTADHESAGLWYWYLPEDGNAALTLENEEKNLLKEYQLSGKVDCFTVYIPEGTRVNMTGGVLTAMTEIHAPRFCWDMKYDAVSETEVIFEGTGRYFCPDQILDFSNWIDYVIEPMEGAEESYFIYGNLFTGEEEIFYLTKEESRYLTNQFELSPGTILELHNCCIKITYGNG